MFEIKNLSVSYGQSAVIRNLSFGVGDNEVLAIMGRNGMGKTTLFKSLMGILPARGGSIKLGEHDLSPLESFQRVRNGLRAAGADDFPDLVRGGEHPHRDARRLQRRAR
jgi:urea transport system ATP-binding protein